MGDAGALGELPAFDGVKMLKASILGEWSFGDPDSSGSWEAEAFLFMTHAKQISPFLSTPTPSQEVHDTFIFEACCLDLIRSDDFDFDLCPSSSTLLRLNCLEALQVASSIRESVRSLKLGAGAGLLSFLREQATHVSPIWSFPVP